MLNTISKALSSWAGRGTPQFSPSPALSGNTIEQLSMDVKPGYMVTVHISPYTRPATQWIAKQHNKLYSAVLSSLIYAHFEIIGANIRAVRDYPQQYHVFTTRFEEVGLSMVLIGFDRAITGYLLTIREGDKLLEAIDNSADSLDLGWAYFDIGQSVNLATTNSDLEAVTGLQG